MELVERQRLLEERGLDRDDLLADPFEQFARWFEQAREWGVHQPEAMVLATADASGHPAARHVLLKDVDDGFVFYTNFDSDKGRQLADNPHAALCFPWIVLSRQVRVAGPVIRTGDEESDAYFATRPRGSQIGAWASVQSSEIADRRTLEERYVEAETRFAGGAVPRPPHWGGFRLQPVELEFWQGRPSRLHDRFRYRPDGGGWRIARLSP